jgi:Fe-S-cluster containining protein
LKVKPLSADVFSLSVHATYRCRHSGECCTAGWDVPIELPVYRSLVEAVQAGRLRTVPAARGLQPFVVDPDPAADAAAIFERTEAGWCVFLDGGSRLCAVHRELGEDALPSTCRHFPRVALRDGRGTFVSLSHYCPTAAGMLFDEEGPLRIVSRPPAFPPRDYEGLTVADGDLPPLLHPSMLMDLDGYGAWEAHMVARCAGPARSPESILATLADDAAGLRRWRPGNGSLVDAVRSLPVRWLPAAPHADLILDLALYHEAIEAVPDELKPSPDEGGLERAYDAFVRPVWPRWHPPLARYIAAKAFASWTAYQGRGIATIVRGLEAAVALVRVEAARACRDADRPLDRALLLESFRRADFILNHLAAGDALAAGWSAAET